MKAQIESSNGHIGGVRDGKVHKAKHHSHHHKGEENAEIKVYLNKLQELVPFMPKNRKLSKLEVITYVIDYIRDLRQTLGLPPCNNDFDMESMMSQMVNPVPIALLSCNTTNTSSVTNAAINDNTNTTLSSASSPVAQTGINTATTNSNTRVQNNTTTTLCVSTASYRQPLCAISSPRNTTSNGSWASQSQEIPQLMDKSPSPDVDIRPVSC